MSESVIADCMASLQYFPHDVRAMFDELPDQEERGASIVFRKNFEESERVRIVRAIVIGQCDLPGAFDSMNEGASVPLPRRSHRLVPGCNGGCGYPRTDQRFQHVAILANSGSQSFE